jgi:hypothetical protein
MSGKEVIALLETSKCEKEWNFNCNKVKESFGGRYPGFWYEVVIMSGLAYKVSKRWKDEQD